MLKLMKLELRKFRIGNYIRAALFANVCILAVICVASTNAEMKSEILLNNYGMAFSLIDTLVRATYIVFAAVLISRLVIEEFRCKTITVMFMYPIPRKKIIAAKLLLIMLFTLVADVIANMFAGIGFVIFDHFVSVITEPLTSEVIIESIIRLGMSALASSFLSLVPLYFGMRNHSIPATIVSSLIVVAIVCQNINGFSLYSIIAVPVTLAVLGAATAYLTFADIEHVDVLK